MDYHFEIVETSVQPVISVRKVTSVVNLPLELGKAYHSIMEYLGELGEESVDMPFAAYYNMDMENLDVEMGFPVLKTLPSKDEMCAGQIPAGKKAVCMYKGAYKEMGPVYEAMTKWISDNSQEPTGAVYEFYYNSPINVPESELLTKIVFLLK